MRNLIFIFTLFLAALAGCSDKYNSLAESAPPPGLTFERDTLYIREKDPTNINASGKGILNIYCMPAGHQFNLSFTDTSGKLHFVYRGDALRDSEPFVVTDDPNTLYVYADTAGAYAVDFYLTDQLGKTTSRKLMIYSGPAQVPIAMLDWRQVSSDSTNYEYFFDASLSTQVQGSIMRYHYDIDGSPIEVTQPYLRYFFHSVGLHTVAFYVTDDLGQTSSTITYTIDVQ